MFFRFFFFTVYEGRKRMFITFNRALGAHLGAHPRSHTTIIKFGYARVTSYNIIIYILVPVLESILVKRIYYAGERLGTKTQKQKPEILKRCKKNIYIFILDGWIFKLAMVFFFLLFYASQLTSSVILWQSRLIRIVRSGSDWLKLLSKLV